MPEDSRSFKPWSAGVVIIAVGFILKLASSVTLPLAISLFFFLLLNPLVNKLEKIRVPRWVAIVIAMLILMVVFSVLILFVSFAMNTIIMELPRYTSRVTEIFGGIETRLVELIGLDADVKFFEMIVIDWQGILVRTLSRISESALSILSTTFLVFIFVLFLLLERQSLIPKLRLAIPNRGGMKMAVMFERINRQTSRYLVIKSLISLGTGVLFYLAAIATRLDFAFVWGVLAFVMNFIPSIGSVIITTSTVLMAVIQFFPDYVSIIYVAVLMLSIQMVLGNIIDPRMQGDQLNLSPFVILVALVFWGYIWGIVGMFLAVPLTSIMQIFFANIKGLKPIAVLISSGKAYRKQIAEEERRRKERYEKERLARKERRMQHQMEHREAVRKQMNQYASRMAGQADKVPDTREHTKKD